MLVDRTGPLRSRSDPAIVPDRDDLIALQEAEMGLELLEQLFVFVRITKKDFGTFRRFASPGHRKAPPFGIGKNVDTAIS